VRRLVVALGGNALCRRGEPITTDVMRLRVAEAASELARVCSDDDLVVTHGNGPQVGLLAIQTEVGGYPAPLDVLGAASEGMIGFLVEEALAGRMPSREVVVLLTQVVVDRDDPAFARPEKPVGPIYAEADARRVAEARGWTIIRDGAGFRRCVPSPEPRAIRELRAIARLLEQHVVVVCAGGGGIPVIVDDVGVSGVPAVVDKDLTASLLARELGADALVLLTDVDGVYDRGERAERAGEGERAERAEKGALLRHATPAEMRARRFAPGSMGPKVEAACRFAERTNRPAYIGRLGDLETLLAGRCGTCIAT
jgi:carbamate kinase